MNSSEILMAARDLISRPEMWTQGVNARDKYHRPTLSCGGDAVCWCAMGALLKIDPDYPIGAHGWLTLAAMEFGENSYARFNDTSTHPAVLRMFDIAIQKALENEQA